MLLATRYADVATAPVDGRADRRTWEPACDLVTSSFAGSWFATRLCRDATK